MTLTATILLILAGLFLVLLEILVVPGLIVGIIGAVMMIGGVVSAWINHGSSIGLMILVGTAAATVLAIILAFRSKTWKKVMLQSSIDSRVNTLTEDSVRPGDTGITVSRLAPMGHARINDQHLEVQSITGFVNENTPVIVVKVTGNKILVKPEN